MSKTVLIVDDEQRIVSMIRAYLLRDGYDVVTASDGQEALTVARQSDPDLVLLDIMMPEMDGLTFLKLYQRERTIPIILLTAKVEEHDKVLGLELGADDYITKPFGMQELMARVRTAFRRAKKYSQSPEQTSATPAHQMRVKNLAIDMHSRNAWLADSVLDLTRTEFDLLYLFMSTPNHVFSRATLLDHIRSNAYDVYDRTIDLHIKNLRAKLGDNPRQPEYIQTVYGVGYRFLSS
ncbi:MAG: response regulator transcription factor [Chloroflexota bacterium]